MLRRFRSGSRLRRTCRSISTHCRRPTPSRAPRWIGCRNCGEPHRSSQVQPGYVGREVAFRGIDCTRSLVDLGRDRLYRAFGRGEEIEKTLAQTPLAPERGEVVAQPGLVRHELIAALVELVERGTLTGEGLAPACPFRPRLPQLRVQFAGRS